MPKFVADFRKKYRFFAIFNPLKISMLTFFGATFSGCHTLFGATFARNMGKFFGSGFIYNGTSAFAKKTKPDSEINLERQAPFFLIFDLHFPNQKSHIKR